MSDGRGDAILIGRGETPQYLYLPLANRHGLIAGATGTGKTITLQVLAEGFSRAGVPVFCADIKGDLSGISQPGTPNQKLAQRAAELGVADYAYEAVPALFWDVFGAQGHPIRATVAEMGPVLLSRILELNETQEGVLTIAFALADDEGLLLLDFKDLRAMLSHVAERAGELSTAYGNVSKATIGTIQRKLLALDQAKGAQFFGEPALDLADLMLRAPDGRGAVSVLAADRLVQSPRLYATFLLWLMSELFQQLPEVGDIERPKLVFFFDEAHLLFRDTSKSLLDKVEQVVRLIRSKGVGIYFVTQNPLDVPPQVLGQLGNRVQHALRAFTPLDQKAVRAAAETFRANPRLKTEAVITELAVGEALVSTLQPGGVPSMVERTRICPPRGRIGPVTAEERTSILQASPVAGKYDQAIDRESAYELLQSRASGEPRAAAPVNAAPVRPESPWGTAAEASQWASASNSSDLNPEPSPWGTAGVSPVPRRAPVGPKPAPASGTGGGLLSEMLTGGGRRQGVAEALAKSVARSVGSQVGTQIGRAVLRGVLGSLTK
jgi:DNA helicase HerA-like ATPase